MATSFATAAGDSALAAARRPTYVDDALVFNLDDPELAERVGRAFTGADLEPSAGIAEVAGMARKLRDEGAVLTPLYPERAARLHREGSFVMAVPAAVQKRGSLSGLHHLQLANPKMAEDAWRWLVANLGEANVRRPVIQYPADGPNGISATVGPSDQLEEQWALSQCGFDKVADQFAKNRKPGPIAIIDQGVDWGHPELRSRITVRTTPPPGMEPSPSVHASAVAGVIAANGADGSGITGCCMASIALYNVWNVQNGEDKYDSLAYLRALKDIASSGIRVLNISLGSDTDDPDIRNAIAECVANGVIVVAAMGNDGVSGNPSLYPARYPGVIAVGATGYKDSLLEWSGTGDHICILAPGEGILTTYGDTLRLVEGTSFAAPMVAAAVWMALSARPCWGNEEVLELLKRSADPLQSADPKVVGSGRLSMPKLANELKARKCRCL